MKFETPIINIEMFETENVITTSGLGDTDKINDVKSGVIAELSGKKTATATLDYSF